MTYVIELSHPLNVDGCHASIWQSAYVFNGVIMFNKHVPVAAMCRGQHRLRFTESWTLFSGENSDSEVVLH